jgi:hypothetical protein
MYGCGREIECEVQGSGFRVQGSGFRVSTYLGTPTLIVHRVCFKQRKESHKLAAPLSLSSQRCAVLADICNHSETFVHAQIW